MSDFLFSSRRLAAGTLKRALEAYLPPPFFSCEERHGSWGSLALVWRTGAEHPLIEESAALTVLTGDPLIGARSGPGRRTRDGGTCQELAASMRRVGSVDFAALLDGHFAVFGIDTATGEGALVTDRFCFVPVFASGTEDGLGTALVLGTHLDSVARAAGRCRIDPVAAVDLSIHLTSTFPHTLYDGVVHLDPGTVRCFSPRGWRDSGKVYWAPAEESPFGSVGEAAEALRTGFADAVGQTCSGHGQAGVLLSGGEDSRAVLGAMPAEVEARCFTYAQWENREVRIARAVARAYSAPLTVAWRNPDHYLAGFESTSALVGGHHLFLDVHGYGLSQRLGLGDLPVVFGGLSSDSLLKAVYHERGRFSGLPYAPFVRVELVAAAMERRRAFRMRLAELRPHSADEWTLLWPFSMRHHGGNVDGNRRLFRSYEPYHGTAVLDVARAVPVAWKQHRRLFLRAMRPLLRRSWYVPHTSPRYPYFGRAANAVLPAGLLAARGVRALLSGQVRARQKAWPKWSDLIAAASASGSRRRYALLDSPLHEIFVPTNAAEIEGIRGVPAVRELMIMQLAYLTRKAAEAA